LDNKELSVKVLYCSVFPEIPQGIYLLDDCLHSLVGLMKSSIYMKVIMEHQKDDIDRGKPKYAENKSCPSDNLSTTNTTWGTQ